MIPLPIDSILPSLTESLRARRAAVLTAPPGAGKTTRVPPALLRAGLLWREHPNVVMLQPRRVAARASAERIAVENGWTLGREVGYHIRFDRRMCDATRIRILTEGILTRQLVSNPFLEGVGAVVLDEFHERHIDTDMAIALLREIRQTVRPDLLILVMSATIEADPVAQYLGDCPILRAEGRTFPVDVEYAAHPINHRDMPDAIAAALEREICGQGVGDAAAQPRTDASEGHVLVFLPGMEEIRRTMRRLEPLTGRINAELLALHGSLSQEEQQRALSPSSRRKVILATNIAETSLTIEGVRTVIDGGFARVARYDAQRGLDRLDLERISQASADQRAGRAGRTGPGRAIRLWTLKQHHALSAFTEPEIRRVDLAATVLALHAWGLNDARQFGWYDPPDESSLASADALLEMLGATTHGNASLSPLGNDMRRLPLHPRIARLLMAAADMGQLESGCALAALLSEKDILPRGPSVEDKPVAGESDLLYRLELLERGKASHVSPQATRQVLKTQRELMRIGRRLSERSSHAIRAGVTCPTALRDEALLKALLLAYPDRVCRRRQSDPNTAAIVGGGAVRLARESVVRHAEFFVALDARNDPMQTTREALVHMASAIELPWLEACFANHMRRERTAIYDEARDRIIGAQRLLYRDLLLQEHTGVEVAADHAAKLLLEAAAPRVEEIFRSDPAADQLLNRVMFLRKYGQPIDLPLMDVLASVAPGKRSLAELKGTGLADALWGSIPYDMRQTLDRQAPQSITLPSGKSWRLRYATDGGSPVLAVKLQELFGLEQTPRLAGGKAAVLLHLLAPNGRPVQITDDLASFWKNTYPQVRKDLRGRYPKHKWPQTP